MKCIRSIQDLWTRCLFCPLCQDECRNIEVSIGPDRAFRDTSFLKEDNALYIQTYFKLKQIRYQIQYDIDCSTNKFRMVIEDESEREMDADKSLEEERLCKRVNYTDAYFWIDGNCQRCNKTHVASVDMKLKMKIRKLDDVGIESETIRLLDQYEVILYPTKDEMDIAKLERTSKTWMENKTGDSMFYYPKHFTHPLVELDFSNPGRAIERIETISTFR